MKKHLSLLYGVLIIINLFSPAEAIEGFYKTLFMDGGVGLNGLKTLPAADYLNYSFEYLATNTVTIQNGVMIQNENDENGVLLYPDGEPRFKLFFSNGGWMDEHGTSLGEEGLGRVRRFYYRGGSYTGACAGAYIVTIDSSIYYNLWPGSMIMVGLANTTVGGVIPDDSPLLHYYDFGNDLYIADIVHSRGGYASTLPPGTEVLLIHDKPGTGLHDNPSCWAYKDNDTTGRIVVMTSHPENESGGELRDYTAAVFQYAFDGAAPPSSKGFLANGEKRIMNKSTADNDPLYTKIGDRQYHHFMVDLTAGATNFVITLDGNDSFNLNLYVARDTFAFASLAGYADTSAGSDKTISIDSAAPGVWYIGVECATTVETEIVTWGYEYTGQLEVLNGVEYTIQADWNITDIAMNPHSKMGVSGLLVVQVEGNTATIRAGNLPPYSMKIFDLQGSLCWEPQTSPTTVIYRWQPESPGMYFVWMKSGKDILTKRFTVVK